jgi:hypothetical protein
MHEEGLLSSGKLSETRSESIHLKMQALSQHFIPYGATHPQSIDLEGKS